MQECKIKKFSEEKTTLSLNLNEYLKYFYERYKEPKEGGKRLLALCYKVNRCKKNGKCSEDKCKIKKILDKDIKDLTEEEKLYFLTYIVFRYRNNMFHGNKGAENWLSTYEKPIIKCIEIMMLLTEIPLNECNVEDNKKETQAIVEITS